MQTWIRCTVRSTVLSPHISHFYILPGCRLITVLQMDLTTHFVLVTAIMAQGRVSCCCYCCRCRRGLDRAHTGHIQSRSAQMALGRRWASKTIQTRNAEDVQMPWWQNELLDRMVLAISPLVHLKIIVRDEAKCQAATKVSKLNSSIFHLVHSSDYNQSKKL